MAEDIPIKVRLGGDASELVHAFNAGDAASVAFGVSLERFAETTLEKVREGFSELVKATSDQEQANARLDQALRSTDQFSTEYSDQLRDLADGFSKASRASDDELKPAMAQLLTIGHATRDQIEPLTKAALDLAAGMGEDLGTAVHQVSLAIEGHGNALKRAGITTVDFGSDTANMAGVVAAIEGRFKGSAAAATQTYAGQMDVLKHSTEEAMAALGTKLGVLDTATGGMKLLGSSVQFAAEHLPEVKAGLELILIPLSAIAVTKAEIALTKMVEAIPSITSVGDAMKKAAASTAVFTAAATAAGLAVKYLLDEWAEAETVAANLAEKQAMVGTSSKDLAADMKVLSDATGLSTADLNGFGYAGKFGMEALEAYAKDSGWKELADGIERVKQKHKELAEGMGPPRSAMNQMTDASAKLSSAFDQQEHDIRLLHEDFDALAKKYQSTAIAAALLAPAVKAAADAGSRLGEEVTPAMRAILLAAEATSKAVGNDLVMAWDKARASAGTLPAAYEQVLKVTGDLTTANAMMHDKVRAAVDEYVKLGMIVPPELQTLAALTESAIDRQKRYNDELAATNKRRQDGTAYQKELTVAGQMEEDARKASMAANLVGLQKVIDGEGARFRELAKIKGVNDQILAQYDHITASTDIAQKGDVKVDVSNNADVAAAIARLEGEIAANGPNDARNEVLKAAITQLEQGDVTALGRIEKALEANGKTFGGNFGDNQAKLATGIGQLVALLQNLPHHAAGGDFNAGMAVVGENGPELAMFGRGGTIIPNGGGGSTSGGFGGPSAQDIANALAPHLEAFANKPVYITMDGAVIARSTNEHNSRGQGGPYAPQSAR